jgi:metallophosphoesterase superfamily enzyme
VVTAVISDLHLGTRTKADLLTRPEVRGRLIGELASVDHVVLLGDSIELRDGPPGEAFGTAAPFFEELGEALSGRRVTLVPGNHDYQLASRWLRRRGSRPLGLAELSTPLQGDPLHRLAGRMGATELVLAYPGL